MFSSHVYLYLYLYLDLRRAKMVLKDACIFLGFWFWSIPDHFDPFGQIETSKTDRLTSLPLSQLCLWIGKKNTISFFIFFFILLSKTECLTSLPLSQMCLGIDKKNTISFFLDFFYFFLSKSDRLTLLPLSQLCLGIGRRERQRRLFAGFFGEGVFSRLGWRRLWNS